MTENSKEVFLKRIINGNSCLTILIRAVKMRPELWNSSSPAYWNMHCKQKSMAQWVVITKAIRKRFDHLYFNTEDIEVIVIKRKWESLRMNYCKLIRETANVSSTCEASRFLKELQFLKPVIMSSKRDIGNVLKHPAAIIGNPLTKHNAKIFYSSVFNDDTFIEVLIGEVEKRPILWDSRLPGYLDRSAWYSLLKTFDGSFESLHPKIQDIAVTSLLQKWYKLKNSYITQIPETGPCCMRNNLESFDEQLKFLKPFVKNSNRHVVYSIPHDDTSNEQVSTSDDISYSEKGPSAINIPSDEINLSSFQQDCRSPTTESSSRIAETCENIPESRSVPLYEYDSSDISSYGYHPNNFYEYIGSAQTSASIAFLSHQQLLNSFPQNCRSLITEYSSRISASCGTSPASCAIPFGEYNPSDFSSNIHYPNTFHENISVAQGPVSMSFPSYKQDSNSFQREYRSWIPDQYSRITVPTAHFPSSSVIPTCAQNSPHILDDRQVINNFHPVTSRELAFLSNATEEFDYISYKTETNQELLRHYSNMQNEITVDKHVTGNVPQVELNS